MIGLHYKNKAWDVAERWNELSAGQLKKIIRVLYAKIDPVKGKLMLLRIISGMNWWNFFKMPEDEIAQQLDLTDFILKKNELTAQKLPKIGKLYGPADELENFRMSEFVFTELYYMQWKHDTDEQALNMLLAILYRPGRKNYNLKKNPEGDPREKFNENLTDSIAKKTAKWNSDIKKLIALWYEGCREALIGRFERVFSGGSGEESKYGMYSIIREVAKDGVFGQFEQVEQQYVTTVLMHLDESVAEAEKMKKEVGK